MVRNYPWGSQGSILGPILFNVFINDLFLFIKGKYICNFADDTTLYARGKELDTISFKIELETNTAIQWLKDNEMGANPLKFELMFHSKYKNIDKTCLLIEKQLNHQIQLNYLELPKAKILILSDIYKIFVTKQIAKRKLFYISENS